MMSLFLFFLKEKKTWPLSYCLFFCNCEQLLPHKLHLVLSCSYLDSTSLLYFHFYTHIPIQTVDSLKEAAAQSQGWDRKQQLMPCPLPSVPHVVLLHLNKLKCLQYPPPPQKVVSVQSNVTMFFLLTLNIPPPSSLTELLLLLQHALLEEQNFQVVLNHGGLWRGDGHLGRLADSMHMDTNTSCLRTARLCFCSTQAGGFHCKIFPPPLPSRQTYTEHCSELALRSEGGVRCMPECSGSSQLYYGKSVGGENRTHWQSWLWHLSCVRHRNSSWGPSGYRQWGSAFGSCWKLLALPVYLWEHPTWDLLLHWNNLSTA